MDLNVPYMKKRSSFGRQPLFCERGPEPCDNIMPNPLEFKHYILRNPVNQNIQHGPIFSKNKVNTIRAEFAISGVNHAEGGWPRDVNVVDPEATQRYRRKIEKDESYVRCVMNLYANMDHYILQNNAIDMFQTYYQELASLPPLEKRSCRTVNVYKDHSLKPRNVSSISWQPDGHKFVVSYVEVDSFMKPTAPITANIWDLDNATAPEMTLIPPVPAMDLQYNQRDRNIIAAGFITGQVGFFDIRKGKDLAGICPPHVAHREMARNVLFINSKSGVEFYSGGPDGACKWWDMRNLSVPTEEMIIDVVKYSFDVQNMANAHGISVLEYEPTIPTRFMVGTEDGCVITGNRKGKSPTEKLPAMFSSHLGSVMSLERNPGFLKNFLTVGDWTCKVWSEECRESAVLWSPPHRYKITAGTWSPHRISLLLLTQYNGVLSIWDFLRRQYEPVLSMQVCSEPLNKLKVHDNGHLVACGSSKGNIYMIELSPSLVQSEKNDKSLLTNIFERESRRERILEAKTREIKLKLRQAEEGSIHSVGESDPSIGDKDLAEATVEFNQVVKKELAAM